MPLRLPAVLFLFLPALAARAADDALIDAMDELHFRPPKEKAKAELVDGKIGKAVRFSFDADARGAFFTSDRLGTPAWDDADGVSFWVKGDGSDHFGGLELIYDDDYAVRYDYAFPLKNTDWTKIVVPWRDFAPVLPGPKSNPLDPAGGNKPSKVSALWFGKWWYWGDYPAVSFAVHEIRLEGKIELDAVDYRPEGAPLARAAAKVKAGKPITVVTMGDSLTDTRHWANREANWPALLKEQIESKYKSKVTVVNPAIGGTQLRQNLVLIPVWLAQAEEPDLVTICFGGNDWDAGMRGKQFREVCADAIDRVRRATRGQAEVLLISTVPAASRWGAVAELAEACRQAAADRKAGLADADKAFTAAGRDEATRDKLYVKDRTHLSPAGHALMAQTILEALESDVSR
jgi:lysophospholipase L1-like esterase